MQPGSHQPIRLAIVRVGGWENWVDTVAENLVQAGFEVTALVFQRAQEASFRSAGIVPPNAAESAQGPFELIHEEIPCGPLGKTGYLVRSATRLRHHLLAGAFDIIYVVDSWSVPCFYLATGGRLRWGGAALVYHTFEWLDPTVHGAARIYLERGICRRADLVVNIDPVRARLQQMLYRLPSCPLWLRNSLSREYPIPPRAERHRPRLLGEGPPADAVAVLMATTAAPDRLALEAIRACARLPEGYRLATIAGAGDYFQACIDLVRELRLSHRVTFLERMSFQRLMGFVASADVGLVLHDARTSAGNFLASPMRLSQFAAAGVPFVASDVPSVAADVYRYELGTCCDATDPAAIADAIRRVAEASLPFAERAQRIRDAFREHLAFEVGARSLVDALRGLVANKMSGEPPHPLTVPLAPASPAPKSV